MKQYDFHPLANIFPLIDGKPYQDLMADILKHGVREPVWLYDGMILDGRNRYRAATAMSVECPVQEYTGSDPTGFVVSLNLHRRHLSEAQRAMVAQRLANMPLGGAQYRSANLQSENVSQSDAADLLNVSTRTVAAASKIQAEAPAEVIKAIDAGDVSIHLASQFIDLPKEAQEEAIQAIAEHSEPVKEVMREAVKKAHVAHNSGDNEWYTPAKHIELARAVMGGIDTDPASSEIANRTVKASQIFTVDDDGRSKQWSGRVWMNPPYAQPLISDFAEAVSSKFESGEIEQACILVNNATETQWFQRMLSSACAVCFPKSRIKFIDPNGVPSGAPLQGQAIIYMGDNTDAFAEHFGSEGVVLCHV